jgi:Pectate lyase superfamily protein
MTTAKVEWLPPSTPGSLLVMDAPPAGKRPKWFPPGTAGQVLQISPSGALLWATAPAGAIPITTAGDLIVGSTTGTPVRLPRGTTGQILQTGPSGLLEWVPPSGGGGPATALVSTKAGLPTAGTAGRLATVTDNVRGLWMDTGSQWVSTAGEVINVKEFGAKGDGIADDTAAIQAVLNMMPGTTSPDTATPTIWVPPGLYRLTTTVQSPNSASYFIMRGASPWTSRFVWDGPAGIPVFKFINPRRVTLQDFGMIGNPAAKPSYLIQFHRAPGQTGMGAPTGNQLMRLRLGGPAIDHENGVGHTADPGEDSNDENFTAYEVEILNSNGYCYQIRHSNALAHLIIGGSCGYFGGGINNYVPGATDGGSFGVFGTRFSGGSPDAVTFNLMQPLHSIELYGIHVEGLEKHFIRTNGTWGNTKGVSVFGGQLYVNDAAVGDWNIDWNATAPLAFYSVVSAASLGVRARYQGTGRVLYEGGSWGHQEIAYGSRVEMRNVQEQTGAPTYTKLSGGILRRYRSAGVSMIAIPVVSSGTTVSANNLNWGPGGAAVTLNGGVTLATITDGEPGDVVTIISIGTTTVGYGTAADSIRSPSFSPITLNVLETLTVRRAGPDLGNTWWVDGVANPMALPGDMIVGGAGGSLSRLQAGTNGYVLTLVAGMPAWTVAPGFSNPMSAAGDVIVGGASGIPTRLAAGTNGHVLTLASGTPGWAAAPGGGAPSYPLLAPNGSAAAPSYSFSGETGLGFYRSGYSVMISAAIGVPTQVFNNVGFGDISIPSTGQYAWSSTANAQSVADLILIRDAANILAQRNSTAGQATRIYNTWTDASNGEWLEASWASNVATLAPTKNGSGTVRALRVVYGPSVTITYSASMTPNAALGNYHTITATNSTAFTINVPTNPVTGQELNIMIRNTSGGALGTATWNAVFKMGAAWVQPATAKNRSVSFLYDGTNWIERWRSAADVSN